MTLTNFLNLILRQNLVLNIQNQIYFYENHNNLNEEGLAIILTSVVVSILIGAITFTGSYIAYAKLSGTIDGRAIMYKGQHIINLLLLLVAIFMSYMMIFSYTEMIIHIKNYDNNYETHQ